MTTEPWLTAAELAGLPGMPGSEFRTRAKLKADAVPSRAREGRGGGREFDASALPAETRKALMLHCVTQAAVTAPALPAPTPPVPAEPKAPREPSRTDATCADARVMLVRHLHALLEAGLGITQATALLSQQLADAEVEPDLLDYGRTANLRGRGGKPGVAISARTLMRWYMDHGARGWSGLLPAPVASTPLSALPKDVAAVLAAYANASGAARNLTECARRVNTELGRAYDDWTRLYSQARRALPKLPKVDLIKARHTGAERAAKLPFKRRDTSTIKPLDVWLIDGHTFKAKVRHPIHGAPFAPEVTVAIDAATRKVVGWSVSLSENTIAVGDALRHAVSLYGVPAMVYSDNGSGERAKVFDCPVAGLFARLGCAHPTGIPGHPQGHGLIERSWQTHMLRCARQYGSYQGKDADARTLRNVGLELAREQRAVKRSAETGEIVRLSTKAPSWQQFVDDVAKAIETYNALHRHRKLPKHATGAHARKHMTPDEAWEAMLVPADQIMLDAPSLRHLFMPAIVRTAQRGEVQLLNQTYFNKVLMEVDGEQVRVHYDIHDASRVWVWTISGQFVCEAVFGANRMGYMPVAAVDIARQRRVDAAVKRRQQQIDTALAELQPMHEAGTTFGAGMVPSTDKRHRELATVERVDQAGAQGTSTTARPFFESPSERYEWLMQRRDIWQADDATWLAAYAASSDYEALQAYFSSRGIAWPADGAGPVFNQAG